MANLYKGGHRDGARSMEMVGVTDQARGVSDPTLLGPSQGQTSAGYSRPDTSLGTNSAKGVALSFETVSAPELAKLFDVSEQTIRDYAAQGLVVRVSRGRYDKDASTTLVMRHLRGAASGRGGADAVADLTEERARLARAQADAQEMKNALARGKLVAREDVDAAVGAFVARTKMRLLAIPTKLAPVLVTISDPIEAQHAIKVAIYDALRELAGTSVSDLNRGPEKPDHHAD